MLPVLALDPAWISGLSAAGGSLLVTGIGGAVAFGRLQQRMDATASAVEQHRKETQTDLIAHETSENTKISSIDDSLAHITSRVDSIFQMLAERPR